MNIKLSTYASRVKGKIGFCVYVGGRVKDSLSVHNDISNIKEACLTALERGLRSCRNLVSHDDILYIEIQNSHLCEWLDGQKEYKGYSEGLDSVFAVLETLDCRYRFVFNGNPECKGFVEEGKTEVKGVSVEDAFADLE